MSLPPSDQVDLQSWSLQFDQQWSCHCLEGIRFGSIREPWKAAGDHPQIPGLRREFCQERQISVFIHLGDYERAAECARIMRRELVECELYRCGRNAARHLASVGTFNAFRSALDCFMQLGRYGKVELRRFLEPWIGNLLAFERMAGGEATKGYDALQAGLCALHTVSLQSQDPVDARWARWAQNQLRRWQGKPRKRQRRRAACAA